MLTPETIHLSLQESGADALLESVEDRLPDVVIKTKRGLIRARGPNQQSYLHAILKHDINFGVGPAGTGKTYLAVACAVEALESDSVRRLLLVRPAVEAGERLGFLPGDLEQKIDPYLRPLYDALFEMLGFEKVTKLLERNVIEVAPLAYMRGRTLNDSFIILDEAQNTTPEQMKMFLTRIGFGSTAVITGDVTQVDLPRGAAFGSASGGRDPQGCRGHQLHLLQCPRRGASCTGSAHRQCLRCLRAAGPSERAGAEGMSGPMSVTLDLDLQIACEAADLPAPADFERWAAAALAGRRERAELTIRLVDAEEGAALNRSYRGREGPTNVLSFPFDVPPELGIGLDPQDPIADLLGDLVICADVVRREAREQCKAAQAHWAHMVVHGVLHLLDYDHLTESDADEMETLESGILGALGFPSPYEDQAAHDGQRSI